jgi:uncharacterized membrane protein YphA (DoxX/SURF4 family)
MALFAYAIALLIAGLFLHAGSSKLLPQNQRYYADAIESYSIAPRSLSPLLPRLIGSFESLIALLILLPMFSRVGLFAAAALLAVYLMVFAKLLIQGRADINCGCAGPGADLRISGTLLLRNGILIALCLFAARLVTVTAAEFISAWFLILPLAVVLGLIYLSCDQLIVNQQKIEMLRNT